MFNKILLSLISRDTASVKAMSVDKFERPASYKGWIYPLRYLLALRYLKVKQKILEWFRFNKIYPVPDGQFREMLVQQLAGDEIGNRQESLDKIKDVTPSFVTKVFKSALVYPLLIAILLVTAYGINHWYQLRKIENVLANHLPYYSDLLHRKLMLRHNGSQSQKDKIDAVVEIERQKILSDLPEKGGIRDIVSKQLDKLKDPSTNSEEIMLGFKAVNTLFDKQGLPFYLTPKSFSMPCSSLINAPVEQMMLLKKMEELMSNGKPEECRTTMMTVYGVEAREQLYYSENANNKDSQKETELPLFRVKRIDKVPAVDSALGLTFKERGIGSIILMDRIKNFGEESVLPALTFQGRSYIIPYWMQGYYEVEEAVTKGYKKDLFEIYPTKAERIKVKSAVKKIIRNKNRMQNAKLQQTLQRQNDSGTDTSLFGSSFDAISVLLGKQKPKKKQATGHKFDSEFDKNSQEALQKLNAVLLPSIEYHEAYHQIDKTQWHQPRWVKKIFKDELSDDGIDHTLEELGAYLSQLANTKHGHNIWLSKLLIFSLNPMTKGQAEYYASSIIFNMLDALDTGKSLQPSFIASVDEKTEIYKKLIQAKPDEIRLMAKTAYEILFERSVPILHR